MKILACAALLTVCAGPLVAQLPGFVMGGPSQPTPTLEDYQAAKIQAEISFVPADPYRSFEASTNYAKGKNWVQFTGEVISVASDGVLINGGFGIPGDSNIPPLDNSFEPMNKLFFVKRFPYALVDNEKLGLSQHYTARVSGIHTYTTVAGASSKVPELDYGDVWTPPPPKPLTPEQIAELRRKAAEKRKAGISAALKYNQDQAERGDAYGQLRMGERYRDGDGVDKDMAKAKEYLGKSAAQGNATAIKELKNLP